MATKTIRLEIDAYEKLCNARREARESFSNVVRRAHWDEDKFRARNVVAGLERMVQEHPENFLPDAILDRIARRAARRPVRLKSSWQRRP